MSADWLAVEIDLPDHPKVRCIARALGIDRDAVVGKLVRVWGWFDRVSVDGFVDGVVSTDVDELARQDGFAEAMSDVDWLDLDPEFARIGIPGFDSHHGNSAKKRLLKSARQRRYRAGKSKPSVDGGDGQSTSTDVDADASTSATTTVTEQKSKSGESETRATPAALACKAMMAAGCIHVNPSNPNLLAGLAEGVTTQAYADTVSEAVRRGIIDPFAWAIKTARGRHAAGAERVSGSNSARAGPHQPGKQVQAVEAIQRLRNEICNDERPDSGAHAAADVRRIRGAASG